MKHRNFIRVFAKSFAAPLEALAWSMPAHAATISWNGSSSATWPNDANWVGGTAPANSISTDIAQFNTTTSGRMPNVAGTRSIAASGSTFTTTAIPEPSTVLVAAGLLSLMLWSARRPGYEAPSRTLFMTGLVFKPGDLADTAFPEVVWPTGSFEADTFPEHDASGNVLLQFLDGHIEVGNIQRMPRNEAFNTESRIV